MEFIEGQTLRQWIALGERHWSDVVEAFVRAGRGLAAAHAAGLVHRDFKPDNVLVGTDGRVLVMDFGLARQATRDATASELATPHATPPVDPLLTRTGALLGTPAYMSPEQHGGGPVGPAADQFSFCVALYEGLYGERPFAGANMASLAYNVLEGRVRSAPARTSVPEWLRATLLRGLAVDPGDRFPSIDALLAELQRDPPTTRRPYLAGAVALGVAAVVVGAYVLLQTPAEETCRDGSVRAQQVWNDARSADLRAAFAGTGLTYADASWTTVSRTLDEWTESWRALDDATCADDRAARRLDPNRGRDPALACLDLQLADVDALVRRLATADAGEVEHAVDAAAALPSPERCTVPGAEPDPSDPATRASLADARAALWTRQFRQAEAIALPLVTAARELDDPRIESEVLLLVGEARAGAGESSAAETALREAILAASRATSVAAGAGDLEARAWLSMMSVVGRTSRDEGRRVALAAEAAIKRAGDDPLLRAELLAGIGMFDQVEGRHADALDRFERAESLLAAELGDDHPRMAAALIDHGAALDGLGRFSESVEAYARSLDVRERLLGTTHPVVGVSSALLGGALQELDEPARTNGAEASLLRARLVLDPAADMAVDQLPMPSASMPRPDPVAGPHDRALAFALDRLGLLLRARGQFDAAARWHGRAVALLERTMGPSAREVAYPLENLGLVLADQQRHAESLAHLRRALEIFERTLVDDHVDLGIAHVNLGNALWATGDVGGARSHWGQAREIWETGLGADHPLLAYALTGVGRAMLAAGDDDAVATLERALELRDHEDEDRLNVAETCLVLARALWVGDRDPLRAMDLATRARDIVGVAAVDPAVLRRVLSGVSFRGFTDALVPAGIGARDRVPPPA
jgi:tetratricopeptide (TPR) repeat protein